MVIWLYCIFANEAELLPYFLQHYAPQVDRLVMLDNGSTDRSRALIEACPRAVIRPYPAPRAELDSIHMAQVSSTYYHEARGQADYVIWVDGDEFLWSGPMPLADMLRIYREQGIRAVRSVGYQMLSDKFPAGSVPLVEQVSGGVRDNEYDKVSIFDPNLNIRFRPGRHNCRIDGVPAYQGEIKLLHYRYLGLDYLQRRNAYNAQHLSAAEREAGRSYHIAPDHQGKYSAGWFQRALAYASDVVSYNLIEV